MAQTGFKPVHAVLYSLGDTELNHHTIWTVAYIVVAFCVFDKDIFAYNSIMKMKMKILEGVNLSSFMLHLLIFEFCL